VLWYSLAYDIETKNINLEIICSLISLVDDEKIEREEGVKDCIGLVGQGIGPCETSTL